MAVFDEYIDNVRDYITNLKKDNIPSKQFECTESVDTIKQSLPLKIGPGANKGIILRSDTFLELGNPLEGSSSVFLWTDDPKKINHGKITLFGPDLPKEAGSSIPFGRIFLVGGKKLPDLEHNEIVHHQRVSNELEGFMLKSSLDYDTWGRVSHDAAKKGFSLEILGRAMFAIYKERVPEAEAMELIFITSGKEDVKKIDIIAAKAKEISREIVRESWKAKGYDLDCNYDCSSCGDRNVCDDIRDVVKKRAERLKRKRVERKKTETTND